MNIRQLKGWLQKSTSKSASQVTEFAFCKVCNVDIIAHKTVLLKHSCSEKHKLNWEKVLGSSKITDLYKPKGEENASEKPLLYRVKAETEMLLKTLCSNFLKISVIRNTPDIFKLNHDDPANFVSLEKIYLGIAGSDSLAELKNSPAIEQQDIDGFLKSILAFYIALVKNMKEKFSFKEPIFNIIDILDPKIAQSFKTKSLINIINLFPVLKDHLDAQALDNEWRRHALLNEYCEQYWKQIFKLKNDASVLLFPNLKKALSLLLVLPFSNASVERIFSDVFNIKTNKRNKLNTSTLRNLLATQEGVNNSGGCVKFQPSKRMLDSKLWQDEQ
ncbi:hat family c-terminal dimerization region [Holotrichia oblita]|uniref:Hat family c-terminal dimerization region n=1 Tax=Holotrichia oblita TaxID=644536 RepID=A0ACB9SHM6_HOLOL|nr:hat family c-terminal dimerization region [Holotrichia oblita]